MSPQGADSPLQIAIQDSKGFSPFAIAVGRRHYNLAKVIVDIGNAQYRPADKGTDKVEPRRRYMITHDMESDDEEREDDKDFSIASEPVDETFTIDNIAALTESVGSKVSVCEMLCWYSEFWMFSEKAEVEAKKDLDHEAGEAAAPWRFNNAMNQSAEVSGSIAVLCDYLTVSKGLWEGLWCCRPRYQTNIVSHAISKRELPLVQFLISTARENGLKEVAGTGMSVLVTPVNFYFALKKGFTEIAGELIRSTGVELPLDHLVKESKVSEIEKPIVRHRF